MDKRFLKAADGMVYTNGTVAAPCVFLADGEALESWEQIPEEEAIQLQQAQEQDYLQALERFGVMV